MLGQDVAFEVHRCAGVVLAERGVAIRMWNDGHRQHVAFERGDGQADPVYGDGPFVNEKWIEFAGHADAEPPVLVSNASIDRNSPGPSTWPCTIWPFSRAV